MSDVDTVEQANQEQEPIEQVTNEQLAEAGADAAELSTQDSAEDVTEQIDLEDLAGEAKAQGDEQVKAHNAAMASKRHHLSKQIKSKEDQLNQLEQQLEQGVLPQGYEFKPQNEASERPNLDSYKSRLFDDYEGDTSLMLAYFKEDVRKYEEANQGIDAQRQSHIDDVKADINRERKANEQFIKKTDEFRAIVPNIDDGLNGFNEKLIEARGVEVANRLMPQLRDNIGKNAPLVLAAIGMNDKNFDGLIDAANTGGDVGVTRFLTRLEDRLINGLPSAKTISTAASENPVGGDGAIGNDYEKILKDIESGKGRYGSMTRFERAKEKRSIQKQKIAAQ